MQGKDGIIKSLSDKLEKLRIENAEFQKSEAKLKKTEKALRESEKMYKMLVYTSPDAIALHSFDNKVVEVSQQWLHLWGYEASEEVVGRSNFEFIAPEEHDKIPKYFQKALIKGSMRNVELICLRKDGKRFIGEINATVIRDAKGKPQLFMAASRDITERKKMEQMLKKYSKNLEKMVNHRTQELFEVQKEMKNLRKQIKQSQQYPQIIGNSTKILQVIDLINQVARIDSTVLIYGETGSGKDLIARAIHLNSPRSESPFVTINCAALPEHLIESELFGYVKGAFTGALQNKIGLFEEANTGTIFLNEIGDIPLILQGKLLEVLEKGQMRRVGQSKSITIDVRIIAASNTNLEEAVKHGEFRQDLYYRLKVLLIKIPPLRERKEDIPLLVKFFLDKYCSIMNRKISEISKRAMDILCKYTYPGNVRELENIIQHAIVMSQSNILIPQNLPHEIRHIEPDVQARNLSESLAKIEKQKIKVTLEECNGNLSKAAKILGINRTTLWRRVKKFSITI
jgi:two-component system response regulator AtoC